MKKIVLYFVSLFFLNYFFADCFPSYDDYIFMADQVHELVVQTVLRAPFYAWPDAFIEIYKDFNKRVIPHSSLCYLTHECAKAVSIDWDCLSDLVDLINTCRSLLDSYKEELPIFSQQKIEEYRSHCCKRKKCLIIDENLFVGGKATINNLDLVGLMDVIGSIRLHSPLLGPVLSFAYVTSANLVPHEFNDNSPILFDIAAGGSFMSSADISMHLDQFENIDGLNLPAGIYLFFTRVEGFNANNASNAISTKLALLSGADVPESFFISDDLRGNALTIFSLVAQGLGIARLTAPATIQLINTSGAAITSNPTQSVQASLVVVRIQTP